MCVDGGITVGDDPSYYGGNSGGSGFTCARCNAWVIAGSLHSCGSVLPNVALSGGYTPRSRTSPWCSCGLWVVNGQSHTCVQSFSIPFGTRWGAGTCPACGYLDCTMECGCIYKHEITPCGQHGLATQSE